MDTRVDGSVRLLLTKTPLTHVAPSLAWTDLLVEFGIYECLLPRKKTPRAKMCLSNNPGCASPTPEERKLRPVVLRANSNGASNNVFHPAVPTPTSAGALPPLPSDSGQFGSRSHIRLVTRFCRLAIERSNCLRQDPLSTTCGRARYRFGSGL